MKISELSLVLFNLSSQLKFNNYFNADPQHTASIADADRL